MSAKRKDYEQAVFMYESGLSIGQIADYYQITRQAMHKILKRRGVKFRPNIRHGKDNGFFRGGLTADERSHQIYYLAIEKGIIARKSCCEICGSERKVEGHHDSYDKPLEVRWLCHKCHYDWHKENSAAAAVALPPKMKASDICSMGGRASWANTTDKERKEKMQKVRSAKK